MLIIRRTRFDLFQLRKLGGDKHFLCLPACDALIQCVVPDRGEKLHIFLKALTHCLFLQAFIIIKYSFYHFCLRQKYSGDLLYMHAVIFCWSLFMGAVTPGAAIISTVTNAICALLQHFSFNLTSQGTL